MTHKRTLEDWKKTGLAIKHISREALAIEADLSYRFGKTHRDCKKMKRVCKLLGEIRCDLEDQMFYEHPELGDEWNTLFFGYSVFDKENNND